MRFNRMFAVNKQQDSKIFKLKKWLTLPETAKYLSSVCNEEITEADILQLALHGELKLSVYFINKTAARRGNIVGCEDVKWEELPLDLRFKVPYLPIEVNGDSWRYMESLQIDDTQFLNISDDEFTTIEGVWDLPMFGCGQLDIKNKYQRLTGGPEVAFQILGGPVVEGPDKALYQVGKNCYPYLGYGPLTKAHIAKIKRLELSKSTNKRKEKILMLRKERLKVVKNDEFRSGYKRILFGHGLPEDSVLVLRPEVLEDFTQRMLDSEAKKNTATKPHGNIEQNAAKREQVLGAAFAVLAKWPDACKNKKGKLAASKIASMIELKAELFWENARPSLASRSIEELLREWIKKGNISTKGETDPCKLP